MLRVGLTGGLSSGKSTVARMLAHHGAHIISADDIGRELMQPGQPVFRAITDHFGPSVLAPDGTLDRSALARIAFADRRVEELNAIIHPAVIARQAELAAQIAARNPNAVIVVESALLFETRHAGPHGWHNRFDRILLVRATEELKIARFLHRTLQNSNPAENELAAQTAEARRRLAQQIPDEQKTPYADYVITNNGPLADLQHQVDTLWPILVQQASKTA